MHTNPDESRKNNHKAQSEAKHGETNAIPTIIMIPFPPEAAPPPASRDAAIYAELQAGSPAAPEATPVHSQPPHPESQAITPISNAPPHGINKPHGPAVPPAAVPPWRLHSAADPPIALRARDLRIATEDGTCANSACASCTILLRTQGRCSCVWLARRVARRGRRRGRHRVRRTGSPALRR